MIGMILTAAAVYPAIRIRATLLKHAKPACADCNAAPSGLCEHHKDEEQQLRCY
jgi:hypothetical protein